MPFHTVGIALGSNLQNPQEQINKAIEFLSNLSSDGYILHAQPLQSDPVDCPPGSPPFLNTVAEIHWSSTPETLLASLQDYEMKQGRPPIRERNAPRPIDLDILYIDEMITIHPRLTLPHPRAHLRPFVMEPLYKIAPRRAEWILAIAKQNR
jgi:2-amino-4-hydroxy-6-hydroxymethyldihydropteridine diphosphokinase